MRLNLTRHRMILAGTLIGALLLRLQGINWDSGFHFHPDERMLIMVSERITFFSNMNPDFFNYGSLPVYILGGLAQLIDTLLKTQFDSYDGLLVLGRILSTTIDVGVTYFVYRISRILFRNKITSLWCAFFYAIAFFPIQNSHFFIVDTFLNFFATLLIYVLLVYQHRPSVKKIIIVGFVFAACLTTKVTALVFAPVIVLAVILQKRKHTSPIHALIFFSINGLLLLFTTILFSFMFMPYAFLEYEQFYREVSMQLQMNSNPYIFPYTLQYVGTIPYLYYLKNIFFWGLGPIISIFTLIGILNIITKLRVASCELGIKKFMVRYTIHDARYMIYALFYLLYFLVIGKSSVKFMRYMLLMYPFFVILAGYGFNRVTQFVNRSSLSKNFKRYTIHATRITALSAILWTYMFLNIYTTPSTRIQATDWINLNIPVGSTLAVEHWDDRVPIFDPGNYQYEEMTLYDIPDNDFKWNVLNEKLQRSDYIILASNRLYAPLMRLQECDEHGRCYPLTKLYYEKLFSGKLGFKKVAEFTSYPKIHVSRYTIHISDDSADESFTVYDHPKIMIFEKI